MPPAFLWPVSPGITYPAKEAPKLIAEALNPSGSVMKVVFVEYSAKHAHVVTAHKLRKEQVMTIRYSPDVNAFTIEVRQGDYAETLPVQSDSIDLHIDIDGEGNVLGLEILDANGFWALLAKHGGELVLPEKVHDPNMLTLQQLFPRTPAHA